MDLGLEIEKTNARINSDHARDTMCANFQVKWTTLTFLAQICPKMDFGVGISKSEIWIWNQLLQDTMRTNFWAKHRTLNLSN